MNDTAVQVTGPLVMASRRAAVTLATPVGSAPVRPRRYGDVVLVKASRAAGLAAIAAGLLADAAGTGAATGTGAGVPG